MRHDCQCTPLGGFPRLVSFSGAADLEIFTNTATLWRDGTQAFVNTLQDQPLIRGHRFTFQLSLDSAIAASAAPAAPFDPYLFVYNTSYEIHIPGGAAVMPGSRNLRDGHTSFVDAAGYPFAMVLPESWMIPAEYTDLGLAYPEFLAFVSGSTASQDWYVRPASGRTKATAPSVWKWCPP